MKILFSNDLLFNAGLKAYLKDPAIKSKDFWIGKLKDVDILAKPNTDWSPNGRDATKDCVIADSTNEYKWKSTDCTSLGTYLCEGTTPDCPTGYTHLPNAGPNKNSCFKINSGGQLTAGKITTSISTAESLCMEDGTRLATPTKSDEQGLRDWFNYFPDCKYTGELGRMTNLWLGYRHFKQSLTKSASCTSCNWADGSISPWQQQIIPESQMISGSILNASTDYSKCFNFNKVNIKQDLKCAEEVNEYHALCEYRGCETTSAVKCKFPFRYAGRLYNTCIKFGIPESPAWCATSVDSNLNIKTQGNCSSSCEINNCPVGFHPHLATCLRPSASHTLDTAKSIDEAEAKCFKLGARLYQPRSSRSLKSLTQKNGQFFSLGSKSILPQASGNVRVAIGVNFSVESNELFYKDGSAFPYSLIEISGDWSWLNSNPSLEVEKTCIFLKNGNQFINDVCNGYSVDGKDYLSYICEARPLQILGPKPSACHFPFKRSINDEWHHSCIYELVEVRF